jgi:hypothetical protein
VKVRRVGRLQIMDGIAIGGQQMLQIHGFVLISNKGLSHHDITH